MKKQKNKNDYLFLCLILLVFSLFSISIGFSALSTSLTVNGSAYFDPVGMIRVMSLESEKLTNATEIDKNYFNDTINVLTDIASEGEATYKVNITNLGQTDKVLDKIDEVIFANTDATYEINGLDIGDIISAKKSVDFTITFKYKTTTPVDNRLNAKLKFVFSDLEIDTKYAYFKAFNGKESFFDYSKSSITSFARNTTLDLESVLKKTGVKLISNESDDKYNSDYEVYGWVEDGGFYWWSKADIVYFHPKTEKAFAEFSNIVTIDLNGTSTSLVENFAHFFDTCRKLKTIKGSIDTSGLKLVYNDNFDYRNNNNNDNSSGQGLAFMFNDCNNLEEIDLSKFNTTNASDMKRMFGGCKKLKTLDVSNFDTSNVKSMYWMFRLNENLTELDLTNFDTKNVENMFGMFVQSRKIKEIKLGEKFNTSKVRYMENMFYDLRNLTTIYVKSDFVKSNDLISKNMFYSANNLVGAKDTEYETIFSSKYIDATYAKIATNEQAGYFTLLGDKINYTITYNLDGGVASNPDTYTNTTTTFTLNEPKKAGYTFIGWTGSNGNTLEKNVVIEKGSTGNKVYNAHYEIGKYTVIFDANGGTGNMDSLEFEYDEYKNLTKNKFTKMGSTFNSWNTKKDGSGTSINDGMLVGKLTTDNSITLYAIWQSNNEDYKTSFTLEGPCTFNGENSNINGTSCGLYTNSNYINTGIYLFNDANYQKDFEMSFDISDYNYKSQEATQATIMNSLTETQASNNPGIVVRKENDKISLKIQDGTISKNILLDSTTISSIRIIRKNNLICYSINNETLKYAFDFTNFNKQFDVPVVFGSSLKSDGTPWRYSKVKLSNISIKLGTLDNDVTCDTSMK